MEEPSLSILRKRTTGRKEFQKESLSLSKSIAYEVDALEGPKVLIPILRAGLVFLAPFLERFPGSKIGFLGIKRDEKTALPYLYYENLPPIGSEEEVLLLDPMLATGGSACMALKRLKESEIGLNRVTLVTMIAAPEGIEAVREHFPEVRVYSFVIDEGLDDQKFIVPGLGDFGDRFFGTCS